MEVVEHRKREAVANVRWREQLKQLDDPKPKREKAEVNGSTRHVADPPEVRLAHKHNGQGDPHLKVDGPRLPALLVSFVYLDRFIREQSWYRYRDWALDSGAFSAHQSGNEIDIDAYIETCKQLKAEDPTLAEIFSLDVIGDWKASLKNTERMWNAGVEAIPCYHFNEPESVLIDMAKHFPKIALGGVARMRGSMKLTWAKQCFARVWPKPIHGFGFGTETQIMALPWHSVDATNWEVGPCQFGCWVKFGKMSVRGSNQNLRSQIEYFLDVEEKARVKWRNEMEILKQTQAPKVRLATKVAAVGRVNQT